MDAEVSRDLRRGGGYEVLDQGSGNVRKEMQYTYQAAFRAALKGRTGNFTQALSACCGTMISCLDGASGQLGSNMVVGCLSKHGRASCDREIGGGFEGEVTMTSLELM